MAANVEVCCQQIVPTSFVFVEACACFVTITLPETIVLAGQSVGRTTFSGRTWNPRHKKNTALPDRASCSDFIDPSPNCWRPEHRYFVSVTVAELRMWNYWEKCVLFLVAQCPCSTTRCHRATFFYIFPHAGLVRRAHCTSTVAMSRCRYRHGNRFRGPGSTREATVTFGGILSDASHKACSRRSVTTRQLECLRPRK